MWLSLAIALVVAAASAFGASRLLTGAKGGSSIILGQALSMSDIEGLSREQIEALLARLELMEEPPVMYGAMCYEPVAAPQTVDYICPVCGEKTVYSSYQHTEFLEWQLDTSRRLLDEINAMTDAELSLDETRYCEYCTPSSEESPSIFLEVMDEDSTVSSNQISQYDLRMLAGFLSGDLYFETWNDGQEPLRPHIDRIRELLAIE